MKNKVNQTDSELDLDAPWRIGESNFKKLVDALTNIEAKSFVEFGAGVSSIRLSQELPDMSIFAIEHDINFYKEALELKEKYVPENPLSIYYRPLKWQYLNGKLFWTYKFDTFPSSVDAVLIDGPPYWTRRGREACLYQVFNSINVNGLICLDDYNRKEEIQTVKNWLATYSDALEFLEPTTNQKLCLLKKVGHSENKKFSLKGLVDNIDQNLRHIIRFMQSRHPSQKS